MAKKLKAKDYIIPTAFIILLTFVFIAAIDIGSKYGLTIPGIGTIGPIGGNSTSTGGNGATIMPVGKVSFNMALIADFSDGTSQAIYRNIGLPGLDVIQVGGRGVNDVRAQVWVGYTLANSLPAGSNAKIDANVTMQNEKTGHVVWKDYVYNLPIGGTTSTVVQQLPDFAVASTDVFADACGKLTNGTISCTRTGTNNTLPPPRRVDWHVTATVTLTGFSLVPQTFTADTISSADFSTGGITGCTNCGGNGGTITNPPPTVGADKGGCKGACGQPKGTTPTGGSSITEGGAAGGGGSVHQYRESLLPAEYITLPLGSGSWFFANVWTFGLLCLITIVIGILGVFVILRRLKK